MTTCILPIITVFEVIGKLWWLCAFQTYVLYSFYLYGDPFLSLFFIWSIWFLRQGFAL